MALCCTALGEVECKEVSGCADSEQLVSVLFMCVSGWVGSKGERERESERGIEASRFSRHGLPRHRSALECQVLAISRNGCHGFISPATMAVGSEGGCARHCKVSDVSVCIFFKLGDTVPLHSD